MRIVYLCADRGIPLAGRKGASAHVRGLVSAFQDLGHEVVVVASDVDERSGIGAEVVPVPVSPTAGSLGQEADPRVARALGHLLNNTAVERVLQDVLDAGPADLVYERYSPFAAAGALLARRAGVFHVLEVNAPLAWEGKQYRRQALQEAAETLERSAFAATSLLVTVSRELRDILTADGVPPARIEVVPNGVDADLFSPEGDRFSEDGLDGKFVVGFVGNLRPWHGIDVLVDAFRELAADPRYHLLVVGSGPESRGIRKLTAHLPGRVTHVEAVEHRDVPAHVRRMDVAVAPYPDLNRFYFSPLKVLEYMAAGRAVVAGGIGQVNELIRDGENGVLVPPGDAGALAAAVESLAADPDRRRTLGAAAAAEIAGAHRWTHRAERILARVRTEAQC